jgi:hypothetical protein
MDRKIDRRFKFSQAGADDASKLCAKCGMRGPHSSSNQCIEALRDRLADSELANTHLRGRLIANGLPAR